MRTIILCGGRGTRYSEITKEIPKPLIKVIDRSLVEHIFNIYIDYGFNDFILATGYKHEYFKEFFWKKYFLSGDLTLANGSVFTTEMPKYTLSILDTGLETGTGGRIKRVSDKIGDLLGDRFFLTYGDSGAEIDINKLLTQHKSSGKMVTLTLVKTRSNFGSVRVDKLDGTITEFSEKPMNSFLVNGGFMVMESSIIEQLDNNCNLEVDIFPKLVEKGLIGGYIHDDYWWKIDTAKDHEEVEKYLAKTRLND